MALPEHLIDKRIVRRTIAAGKIDPGEYNNMLSSLPDLADQVATRDDEEAAEAADPFDR